MNNSNRLDVTELASLKKKPTETIEIVTARNTKLEKTTNKKESNTCGKLADIRNRYTDIQIRPKMTSPTAEASNDDVAVLTIRFFGESINLSKTPDAIYSGRLRKPFPKENTTPKDNAEKPNRPTTS